jgi:hypothetical protein
MKVMRGAQVGLPPPGGQEEKKEEKKDEGKK